MKNITYLGFLLVAFIFNANAQSDCGSALSINDGTYTVADVTGTAPTTNCADYPAANPPIAGEWYEYTNNTPGDLLVDVTSNLAVNDGLDTKISILGGVCTDLFCVAENDDADFANDLYLSEVSFLAEAGQTYFIVFDATWDATGFDFTVSSSSDLPDAPLEAINPNPADESLVFLVEGTNAAGETVNQYTFGWETPTTSDGATSYLFELGVDNTVSNFETTTTNPGLILNGLALDSSYFWRITSINVGGSTVGPVWEFTTESTLSNDAFVAENDFVHYTNNNILFFESSTILNSVEIYNISGKLILDSDLQSQNNGRIDISSYANGIYIARLNTENGVHSFKFAK